MKRLLAGVALAPPAGADGDRVLPQRLLTLAIAGMFGLGIVGRVVIWRSVYGLPESDEAVGGLMARHLLSGNFSVFYWGQGYGGPLETWLAAPVVAVFGDTWVGLRIIPILLAAATSLTIWRIGLRVIHPYGAATAGAISWVFPSYSMWKSIHFHIFYASGMLAGALTLLLALRLRDKPTRRDVVLLGFVIGLGLWQSFQLVTVVPVVIVWLLIRRKGLIRLVPYALPGLLAGLVPVIVSNLRHGWWSLHLGQIGVPSTYFSRIGTFFTNTLPMSLDLRAPCTQHWFLWKPAALVLYAALIAGFAVLAWRARRFDRQLVFLVIAAFPLIYAINQLTGTFLNPGYVLMLLPALLIGLCSAVSRPLQGLWVMGAVLILAAGTFVDLQANASPKTIGACAGWTAVPRQFAPLIDTLNALEIRRVYATYWIAYRIDYETDERIIAAEARTDAIRSNAAGGAIPKPDDPSLNPRHPQYNAIVSRVVKPAWIVDPQVDPGTPDLSAFSANGYRSKTVGPFTIYYAGAESQGVGAAAPP